MPTPRPHAEVIKAWADGEEVRVRDAGDLIWMDAPNPMWLPVREYRVKPREVVDYTVIFEAGVIGVSFFQSPELAQDNYRGYRIQGFIKRTRLEGKVIRFDVIPQK